MKTKFDIEIESFIKNFIEYKDSKIVLYGTGRMTATLVNGLKGFNIIGLCDRDESQIGKTMYGLPIISRFETEKYADILIINTAPSYWNAIYSRIESWEIPIFYTNGQPATKKVLCVNTEDPYWNMSLEDIVLRVEDYDVISFDIFNTLIQRIYFNEIDLFSLLQSICENEYQIDFNFKEVRKIAAQNVGIYASLDEIYNEIQTLTGMEDELKEKIKRSEIETDLRYCIERKDLAEFCRQIIDYKKVLFVSDMYYTATQIRRFLGNIGITVSKENMYISSEYKKMKSNGSIWEQVRKDYPETRILHIGDDLQGDVKAPRQFGIDSIHIMSPFTMIEKSSIGSIVGDIITPADSIAMGLIANKIVNSPFKLGKTKGRVSFDNNEDLGYCLLGPMMYTFLSWILENATRRNNDVIYFFSREGYLLTEQFKLMLSIFDINNIKPVYLNISRRAIMNASIRARDDLLEVAKFPYDGTMDLFLKKRFNITARNEDKDIDVSNIQKEDSDILVFLKPYEEEIYCEAERQRINYLNYLDKIGNGKNIAIVDSFLYGNTQYYLGKLLQKKLDGYYIIMNKEDDNVCIHYQNMFSCFQDENDLTGKNNEIWNHALFLEAFLTAPHGMVLEIDSQQKPIYAEKMMNQKKFHIREEMQIGIKKFFEDYSRYAKGVGGKISNSFIENIFSLFINDGFIKTDEFKNGFYFDNAMVNGRESSIF